MEERVHSARAKGDKTHLRLPVARRTDAAHAAQHRRRTRRVMHAEVGTVAERPAMRGVTSHVEDQMDGADLGHHGGNDD